MASKEATPVWSLVKTCASSSETFARGTDLLGPNDRISVPNSALRCLPAWDLTPWNSCPWKKQRRVVVKGVPRNSPLWTRVVIARRFSASCFSSSWVYVQDGSGPMLSAYLGPDPPPRVYALDPLTRDDLAGDLLRRGLELSRPALTVPLDARVQREPCIIA